MREVDTVYRVCHDGMQRFVCDRCHHATWLPTNTFDRRTCCLPALSLRADALTFGGPLCGGNLVLDPNYSPARMNVLMPKKRRRHAPEVKLAAARVNLKTNLTKLRRASSLVRKWTRTVARLETVARNKTANAAGAAINDAIDVEAAGQRAITLSDD